MSIVKIENDLYIDPDEIVGITKNVDYTQIVMRGANSGWCFTTRLSVQEVIAVLQKWEMDNT